MTKDVVVEENGRKFVLRVPKNKSAKRVQIDGDKLKENNTEKCDWSITVEDKENKEAYYLIELKGKDVKKAASQIETTIKLLSNDHGGYEKKRARIVCSKFPPAFKTSIQICSLQFLAKYSFELKCSSVKLVEDYK